MKRTGYAAVGMFLVLAAVTAQAADHKFYLGLDVGQANFDPTEIFDNQVESKDDHSTTFTVKIGYRFSRFFALEGGYTDLGDYDATLLGNCLPTLPPTCSPDVQTHTSIDGVMLTAVGIWPLTDHFQLTANAGAIYREVDYRYGIPTDRQSLSEKGTVMRYGVGAGFPVNDRFELGLDWVSYREVGVGIAASSGQIHTVNDGESSVITLGARWRF